MGITSRIRDQLQGKKAAATFEWLGEDVEVSSKQRRQVGRTFYRGFKLGKLTCYVGDTVLVRNADAFDPDCFDGCDIARIVQLYYTGDAFEPRRCEVRWYSRVTDINSNTFKHIPPGCPPVDKEREVVFEERNFVTDVDVESLFCLCTVEEVGPMIVPSTVERKDNLKGPFFVCRFSFRSKKPQLQPLNLDGVDSVEKQETHNRLAARRSLVNDLTESSVRASRTPNKSTKGKENAPKTPRSTKKSVSRDMSPEIAFQGDSVKYELLRNVNSPARSSRTPTKPPTKTEAKTPKSAKKSGNRDLSPEIAYSGNSAKYELLRNVNSPARSSRTPTKSLVKSEAKTPKSGKKSENRYNTPERPYRESRYRVMTPSELDLPTHVKLKLRRLEDQSPESFGNVQLPKTLTPKRKATEEAEEFPTKKQRIALGDISHTQSPNRRRTVNVVNYQQLNRGEVDKDGNPTALTPKSKLKNKENTLSGFSSPTKRFASPTKSSLASPGKKNCESPFKSVRNEKTSPSQSPLMSPKDRKENIKQIGKVRALKKDEITDLLGSSGDEDDEDEDNIEEPMDVEENIEEKKTTRRDIKKSETEMAPEPRKSGRRSIVPKGIHRGLDIESDEELPFPFGTPDFKALKTPQKKAKVLPKSKSTAKKRFICDDCGDKFSSRVELQDHEEDHEDFKPITKTPGRRKSTASKKSEKKTPKKSSRRSLATPGMPEREGPVAFPQTPLEKARAVLHVSAVPRELPCREEEYAEIYGFVEGKLQDGTGGCLYISGVPGTGKTATVREVVRLLKEMVSEGDLPSFEYQEINAMRLTDPHQLWVQVWKHLTGQKVTSAHAASLLEKRFSTPAPRREPTLLLVDELDMLWTRKQDVMYNLFDWPSRPGSKLIVVAIANTMDLPERVMINRVASRLGLTRMNFQPYNHEQLQTIVESRLMGIDAFDTNAVRLVARKTAAASGDARRALDICRRATEIAERKALTGGAPKSPTKSPRKSPVKRDKTRVQVELMDVDQAIKEMFSSPMIMAIRSCSEMEKFLLKGVIAEFMRTGLEEAVLSRVIEQYGSIARFEGYQPQSISEIMLMLNRLAQQTLILTEHSRQDLAMRVRLNISMDDVTYALNQKPVS